MMTCKDCICYEILCQHALQDDELKLCESFKNKADFVEVVRCGECKSFIQSKEDVCAGTCNNPISGLSERICKSDFCSYGKRKST